MICVDLQIRIFVFNGHYTLCRTTPCPHLLPHLPISCVPLSCLRSFAPCSLLKCIGTKRKRNGIADVVQVKQPLGIVKGSRGRVHWDEPVPGGGGANGKRRRSSAARTDTRACTQRRQTPRIFFFFFHRRRRRARARELPSSVGRERGREH